jgi:calcineurin-like phosphoesterase family protein
MTIWFTSDWHLNHTNIIKYCNRPFDNVFEMNEAIINNYNELVKDDDIVYNLGDVCFKSSYGYLKGLLERFNGSIIVVLGNHDNRQHMKRLLKDNIIKAVAEVLELKIDQKLIWLSHYAHRIWNKKHYGAYHLYGHSHSNLESYDLSFDVGVDCWNFKPISFDEIVEKMNKLDVKNVL